jgi:hypothetical protein
MRRLLRLYPRAWRERYESEMRAVLEGIPFSPLAALDLVACAVDAHLHPGGVPGQRRLPLAIRAVSLAVLAAIALTVVSQAEGLGFRGRMSEVESVAFALLPAGMLSLLAFAGWRAGWALTAWFCALAALELVVTGGVLPQLGFVLQPVLEPLRVAAGRAWHPAWFRLAWLFAAALAAGCGAIAAVLLRRAGVARPTGFAIGVALAVSGEFWAFFPSLPVVWPSHPTWFRLMWVLDAALVLPWAMLTAALLRRSGLPWWVGAVVGFVLWGGLGSTEIMRVVPAVATVRFGLLTLLPYVWQLPAMLWAAVVAALVSRPPDAPAVPEAALA